MVENLDNIKLDYNLKQDDLILVGDAELDDKGLVHHHIQSANDLYEVGIPQIVTQVFKVDLRLENIRRETEEEKNIKFIHLEVRFMNVDIHKPTVINYDSGVENITYPNICHQKNKTYHSKMNVDAYVKATAHMQNESIRVKEEIIENITLCRIPIMVKSKFCNTNNLSSKQLIDLNEDPLDYGGYYIIDGIEWSIDCIENILFNKVRIFKNEGYAKEIMRAEFISKPGDYYLNSDQFIIRWLNDNQITIEIKRDKMKGIAFPFYLLFRILGWNRDKMIFNNIILDDLDKDISKNINTFLMDAFNAKYSQLEEGQFIYNQMEVLQYVADQIKNEGFEYLDVDNYEENYQKIIQYILNHLDIHFLQHMGSAIEDRNKKLRFLCLILRKMFLVKLGNMEQTDRDTYNSKRIHAAGTSYAKSFKICFNASIIQSIKSKMIRDFKSMSFFHINLKSALKSSIQGADFEKAIVSAIKAGNKSEITINKKKKVNRLSSQLLARKNQLNVIGVLRQVTTTSSESAKQSERANEMRRVHMSFLGYICPIHSPEGEKVGINKQISIFATVSQAYSSNVIKNILLEDKEVYPLETIDYIQIRERKLCNVFVNGDWIGFCDDALGLTQKYRMKRRAGKIGPKITIVWDNTQGEIYFWSDVGRMLRPLLIVYNTKRDADLFSPNERKTFKQGIKLNQKHIDMLYSKRLTIDDLLEQNIIEYIAPEEQENMFLCPSYEELLNNKNNELKEYTHLDIPQALMGLTALTSPLAHHNQTPRITFQTSQGKQTCGVPALNWPFRADKEAFLQYNSETPIVKTLSNKYLLPNGSNAIVAIMCNTGYNVEDSIIINAGSTVGKGMYSGCKFTYYKTDLEQKEEFGNPSVDDISGSGIANYGKLINGFISIGERVEKNDVLIGKFIKTGRGDDTNFTDRSVIYKEEEHAIVHNVIIDRNENDEQFCKVVLRKPRPMAVGDKMCLTPDHEVLTLDGWKNITDVTLYDKVATLNPYGDIIEWDFPTETYKFAIDEEIYSIENEHISLRVTLNHKMYVREYGENTYKLIEARNIIGQDVEYLKSGINSLSGNNNKDIRNFAQLLYKMDLSILSETDKKELYDKFDIDILNNNLEDIKLPKWIYMLDNISSSLLIEYILDNFSFVQFFTYYCNSQFTIDILQLLVLLSYYKINYDLQISTEENRFKIEVNEFNDKFLKSQTSTTNEYKQQYKGDVYCINVPNHIFMTRRNNKYCWTGNSSRAGQKGICGLLMKEEDMPFTEDGIKPSLIINPHAIPSRMTIGQLYESLLGNYCANKATQTDATIFKKIDIETIANELESMGFDRYGYHRLYNGITGEFIDSLIFMGPVFYQRLQKFVVDTAYTINRGGTDVITGQPSEGGKASKGGLRLGEMERDVLASHGVAGFISEKFFDHSDGFTEYICRCGKPAVVNIEKGIYKCNWCKDNSVINSVPTSISSKLFMQEMESMNIGIKRGMTPYTYEHYDEEIAKQISL